MFDSVRNLFTRDQLSLLTCQQMRRLPTRQLTASIRARCATMSVAEHVSLCRVLGRYKMLISNSDTGLSPHLMLDGYWEIWLTQAILRTVHPGMVVADVGANLGYFSLLMADLVGPSGLVHAFEPNPLVLTLLRRSVELNGFSNSVIIHPEPLWRQSGETVSMVVTPDVPQNARVISDPVKGALSLTTAALDDILPDRRLDVIKIDAEGAELDIWEGMQGIVAAGRSMTVFLEFVADRYRAPDLFLARLQQHGFHLLQLDHSAAIRALTTAEVLAQPSAVDWMLVLKR